MSAEDQILEVIENKFGRRVLVRLDFINDYLRFLFNLTLRKGGMKYNIRQQFKGPAEVLSKESRIDNRLFFIGVSIQVTTYILHTIENMPGFPLLCTFKNKMFHKVRHALFILKLITGSGINSKTTISYIGIGRLMDNTQTVGKCIFVMSR